MLCTAPHQPTCSAHTIGCTQFSLNMLGKCPAPLCIPGQLGTVRLIQHPSPSRDNFKVRSGWSGFVQSCSEYFQGWMLWKFTGQPEPVHRHHNCDLFTLWLVFPSLWLVNIASCPFAAYLQPFWVCIFYRPQKIAKEGNLKPSLLQSEPTKLPQPLLAHQLHQPLAVLAVCSQTCCSELVFLLPVLQLKS